VVEADLVAGWIAQPRLAPEPALVARRRGEGEAGRLELFHALVERLSLEIDHHPGSRGVGVRGMD
jgi:hypothetical protein